MGSLDENVSFYGRSPKHYENCINKFSFLEGDPFPCANTYQLIFTFSQVIQSSL